MKKFLAVFLLAAMVLTAAACDLLERAPGDADASTEVSVTEGNDPTGEKPTEAGSDHNTERPTEKPTDAPTEHPTEKPTEAPTEKPTEEPTTGPDTDPTNVYGTESHPLTVEDAIAMMRDWTANQVSPEEGYVTGVVTSVTYQSTYNSYNVYLKGSDTFELYSVQLNGCKAPNVGDTVVAKGYYKKFVNNNTGAVTYEIAYLSASSSPTGSATSPVMISVTPGEGGDETGTTTPPPVVDPDPTLVYSPEGLAYSISSDGSYYTLESLGTCTAAEVVIPSTFNGKPVKAISFYFSVTSNFSYLTKVTFEGWVENMPLMPFNGATKLREVVLPETWQALQAWFFTGTNVTSVYIPASVTSIHSSAFYNCSTVTAIRFGGTRAQWNAITKGSTWDQTVKAKYVTCIDGTVSI